MRINHPECDNACKKPETPREPTWAHPPTDLTRSHANDDGTASSPSPACEHQDGARAKICEQLEWPFDDREQKSHKPHRPPRRFRRRSSSVHRFRTSVESVVACITAALHPRRLMIAPGAVGCKRLLDSRLRCYDIRVTFTIEFEREDDGRWIAEVPVLAGVLCYGRDRNEAMARVQALALRVIAERLEHGEAPPELLNVSFQAA